MLKKYALPFLAPDGGGGAAVAPAPTPAPAAPSPGAAPSAAPGGAGGSKPSNPFSKVDSRAKTPPAAAPAAGAPTTPATPTPAPGDKPASDKSAAAPAPAPKGSAPAELRGELEKLKGELATRTKAHSELEAKIKDYEARGKDVTTLNERLSQMEKAMEAKDAELRALKQEASPEFKEKWDKPYFQAVGFAKQQIEKLTVATEDGQARPATWEDFAGLYQLARNAPQRALSQAKAMFGEDAFGIVVDHINALQRKEYERNTALEEERAQYKAKQADEDAKAIQNRERIKEAWERTKAELSEAEEYAIDPTDKELGEVYKEGLEILDAEPQSTQERIVKNAHIRQRAALFPVLQMKISRMNTEIAKLKKELEEANNPIPGKTRRSGGDTAQPDPNEDWVSGLRKAVT